MNREELKGEKAYRAEIEYTPFKGTTARRHGIKQKGLSTYRLVVTKQIKKLCRYSYKSGLNNRGKRN